MLAQKTDLFVENVRTFEQLTQIGQLFTFFVLFLTDTLQSLRQIRNVRTEMFDCFQSVLEVTGKNKKNGNNMKLFSLTALRSINSSIIWISGAHQSHDGGRKTKEMCAFHDHVKPLIDFLHCNSFYYVLNVTSLII
jgi:hypothetical protein